MLRVCQNIFESFVRQLDDIDMKKRNSIRERLEVMGSSGTGTNTSTNTGTGTGTVTGTGRGAGTGTGSGTGTPRQIGEFIYSHDTLFEVRMTG